MAAFEGLQPRRLPAQIRRHDASRPRGPSPQHLRLDVLVVEQPSGVGEEVAILEHADGVEVNQVVALPARELGERPTHLRRAVPPHRVGPRRRGAGRQQPATRRRRSVGRQVDHGTDAAQGAERLAAGLDARPVWMERLLPEGHEIDVEAAGRGAQQVMAALKGAALRRMRKHVAQPEQAPSRQRAAAAGAPSAAGAAGASSPAPTRPASSSRATISRPAVVMCMVS